MACECYGKTILVYSVIKQEQETQGWALLAMLAEVSRKVLGQHWLPHAEGSVTHCQLPEQLRSPPTSISK